jgi:hypothetical protein
VVALVSDLMDRSRVAAALPETEFARDVAACADADIVIVDLARFGPAVGELRRSAPGLLIVAFGPHVDEDSAAGARAAGADRVWPRSRFFRDPKAAISTISDLQ